MRIGSVEQRRTLNATRCTTDKRTGASAAAGPSAAIHDATNDGATESAAHNATHSAAARIAQRVVTGILPAKVGSRRLGERRCYRQSNSKRCKADRDGELSPP
jgi:hypothetical protein